MKNCFTGDPPIVLAQSLLTLATKLSGTVQKAMQIVLTFKTLATQMHNLIKFKTAIRSLLSCVRTSIQIKLLCAQIILDSKLTSDPWLMLPYVIRHLTLQTNLLFDFVQRAIHVGTRAWCLTKPRQSTCSKSIRHTYYQGGNPIFESKWQSRVLHSSIIY